MVIRSATLMDQTAIFRIALKEAERYPFLKPDAEKIKALIIDAISSARHFCMVAEAGGGVKAVLIGLGGDNMWAQRQFCSIAMWVSKLPGAGAALLREFKKWVLSRPAIRVAGMSVDANVDPRALSLLDRIGFRRHGGAQLLYRMEHINGLV